MSVVASFSVVAIIIVVINYVKLTDPFVGNVLCVLHRLVPRLYTRLHTVLLVQTHYGVVYIGGAK